MNLRQLEGFISVELYLKEKKRKKRKGIYVEVRMKKYNSSFSMECKSFYDFFLSSRG